MVGLSVFVLAFTCSAGPLIGLILYVLDLCPMSLVDNLFRNCAAVLAALAALLSHRSR
jgi:hypothetical protein